jgi:hypothetical protein
MRWLWPALLLLAGSAFAQAPAIDDLARKQIAMLAAEAQFFSTLAQQQKDELDKLKATPCGGDTK